MGVKIVLNKYKLQKMTRPNKIKVKSQHFIGITKQRKPHN